MKTIEDELQKGYLLVISSISEVAMTNSVKAGFLVTALAYLFAGYLLADNTVNVYSAIKGLMFNSHTTVYYLEN